VSFRLTAYNAFMMSLSPGFAEEVRKILTTIFTCILGQRFKSITGFQSPVLLYWTIRSIAFDRLHSSLHLKRLSADFGYLSASLDWVISQLREPTFSLHTVSVFSDTSTLNCGVRHESSLDTFCWLLRPSVKLLLNMELIILAIVIRMIFSQTLPFQLHLIAI
jgi:hypothetical protein